MILEGSIARNKGLKMSKNHQIPTFGFECVAKDIEGGLKVLYTSYMVYSQN